MEKEIKALEKDELGKYFLESYHPIRPLSIWERIGLKFCKNRYMADSWYRATKTTIIRYKILRGRMYIEDSFTVDAKP